MRRLVHSPVGRLVAAIFGAAGLATTFAVLDSVASTAGAVAGVLPPTQ